MFLSFTDRKPFLLPSFFETLLVEGTAEIPTIADED
jgi:hypothetical protein